MIQPTRQWAERLYEAVELATEANVRPRAFVDEARECWNVAQKRLADAHKQDWADLVKP